MKYLITGGCGFIGSHLAEKLVERGDEVVVLDNLSTGCVENVQNLLDLDNFSLVIDTILNPVVLEGLVHRCDFVFHLAAAVGVKNIMDSNVESITVNVEGTAAVLRLCSRFNRRVLITSTSEVYGKNENIPFNEDGDIVIGTTKKKRWSYACTKAMDEFLALAFYEERGLPVVIVRLFNTVGPRQTGRYGMVVPRFVAQCMGNNPVTVFGSGTQTRCFVHVYDVVETLLKLIDKRQAYGQVFNLGSTDEITIKELASKVKALTGSRSEIIFVDPATVYASGFEDMMRRVPDISRISKLTGFKPVRTIDDIIVDCIEHKRECL